MTDAEVGKALLKVVTDEMAKSIKPYSVWRHVKTDSLYVVLGVAKCSTNARPDEESVVYVSVTHGRIHYREVGEFLDGRFVPEKG